MKINIAASHRFHLLDLARELEKQGHQVTFYSYVPKKRAIKYGLKAECSYSLFYYMLPFLGLVKLSKRSQWSVKLINVVLDTFVSKFMKPCDVFIALGTVYKNSFVSAKKNFGAVTILEWGSKHIIEQLKCFEHLPNRKQYSSYSLNREISGYKNADYISIASDHVKQSFLKHGYNDSKLIVNPYGVDLLQFYPTKLQKPSYDLIYVGGWRYEKGCDLIVETCREFNFSLLHVGSLVNMDFPKDKIFTHIDSVDQKELVNYYSKAKVFVLPSLSEGLAMVQSQALVCGLPIVCSKDSGGRDLRKFIDDKKWIIEMEEFSTTELEKRINEALYLAKTQRGLRNYSKDVINELTWEAYGKRYDENLRNIMNKKNTKYSK